jgi:hypothetical protein
MRPSSNCQQMSHQMTAMKRRKMMRRDSTREASRTIGLSRQQQQQRSQQGIV